MHYSQFKTHSLQHLKPITSGGPPEDGREKRPKHVEVLYLQTRF
jgi:hypothetical protein